MQLRIQVVMVLGALLALATNAFPREVSVDYDHHLDFSQYKTYSWAKVETPNSLWDDRVKEAIDKELENKGLRQVPSGGDVSVVAAAITREKPTLRTIYDGFDGWIWGGFADATTTVEDYKVGTLVVDMFDSNTKKLIWRASASDVLSDKPDKNIKELEKSVHKMFEGFPPKGTKVGALLKFELCSV